MDKRIEQRSFAEELKRSVVSEVEIGARTINELKKAYGILGHSTILKWCRLFASKKYPTLRNIDLTRPRIKGEDEKILLLNKIKVLEMELKESQWKQATLETMIDIAERHHSIVIKKNSGQKLFTQ